MTVHEHHTEGKPTCTEGKPTCTEVKPSIFDTDIQIFCVMTQHSTAEWHNVPWLHNTLIFGGTELCPHRYWSHFSKTIVNGKDVSVYTMKTHGGSTVPTALICNLSRKQRWVIRLMQQLLEHLGVIHNLRWIKGRPQGWSDVLERREVSRFS